MKNRSQTAALRRRCAAIAASLIAAALPALPQNASSGDGEYSKYGIGPFGGYQWFQIYADDKDTRVSKLEAGPVLGVRFTQDISKHWGFEEGFTMGFNDLKLRPSGLEQYVKIGANNYTVAVNPVLHFTPREAKFRPFVTMGPGFTWYAPTQDPPVSLVPGTESARVQTKSGPSLNFGGGLKVNLSPRLGLRFDLRDLWTQGRYFGLLPYATGPGALYSPRHGTEHALAATVGVMFGWGGGREAPAPAPAPPPPPAPKPVADLRIGGISGARDVCPGENVQLQAAASGWLPDQTPAYQWTVNGQPVPGATSATFTVPTQDSGTKNIAVTVSVPGASKTSEPVSVRVKDYAPPKVQFPLAQSRIPFGDRLPLNATATASECGGPSTIRYSASEGSVSGDTFDSGSLAFDPSNRLREQTKTVRLTATATDQKGGTGTATSEVTVALKPEARRLDDIVFPARSARVNNCAKRLLLEQLTPMLRDDPNATVILIGHRDEREKGAPAANLDRLRTLNAAAVLSAGTGICPQLELGRVKTGWVGTDQTSAPKPSLCGTSTDVKERSGQAVNAADQRAQFRRVEVWIVPGGADMPAGIQGLKDVPAADIQKLGCPK